MIDSHCHLDLRVWGSDEEVDAVVARAHAAGVSAMVAIGSGYGFESAERAIAVARRHPGVRASAGLHPHDASEATDERLAALYDQARAPEVLALGEMGLDYHYDHSPREVQKSAFRAQMTGARELGLPIILHDRESGGDMLRELDDARAWELGVLFHCYTGEVDYMQAIVARGGYISIPGIVTFKNGEVMREVARRTPADRLLLETDSPFLTPVPHRGTRNEPQYVTLVAAKVAELRGLSVEALVAQTDANTRRFYRWG